jgi:hypothetical protein
VAGPLNVLHQLSELLQGAATAALIAWSVWQDLRVRRLAAQLRSEMRLPGGRRAAQ